MEKLLKDFDVASKNPSEEAQRRWRSAVSMVKNRRRRFRMVADLAKRSEAEKKRRGIQIIYLAIVGGTYFIMAKLCFSYILGYYLSGIHSFKDLCGRMRVLIVLDDVENVCHVKKLIGDIFGCFGYGR